MDRPIVENDPHSESELTTTASRAHQVWNPARSFADSLADGHKSVSEEQHRQRLEICGRCELHQDGDGVNCGCRLPPRARDQMALCPMNKWPRVKPEKS